MFEKIKNNFIDFIISSPKKSILLGLGFFLLLTSGARLIQSDFSPRIWFGPESKQIKALDDFEKRFGGDQNLIIGFYTKKSIFDKKILKQLQDITYDMWRLPNIIRVDTITNFSHVRSLGDDIEISPLVEDPEQNKEIEKNIRGLKELKNNLINDQYNFVISSAQLQPLYGDTADYTPVINQTKKLIEKYQDDSNKMIILGNVAVTAAFKEISKTDNASTIPIMFGLVLLILLFTYRSVVGFAAPLFIAGITIVSTFGVMGYLGHTFNSILAAIPGILIAICLADTVHILTSYYTSFVELKDKKLALRAALENNFLATVLTTLTTSISFFTVSYTDLLPIHNLGLLAGVGTILAWINTFLFLPSIILLVPDSLVKSNSKFHKNTKGFNFSGFIWKFKTPIVICFIILSLFSFYKAMDNQVNSDPLKYFTDKTKIKSDYNFTKEYFSGIRGIEVEIDSGKIDGAKSYEFLQRVEAYIEELRADPEIIQVNSIVETLKTINMQLNNGDGSQKVLPDSNEKIAEALVLYTMGLPAGQGIENNISLDQRFIKLRLKWTPESTKESMAKDIYIHKIAKKYKLKTQTGGFFPIYTQVNNQVVDSFSRSMVTAIILVSLIILIIFRNPMLAFLSMMPNIIPLSFGAAYMALNNIYIDIGTSIVGAICLGIAVDDTIHFVTHFVQNKKKTGSTQLALDNTFNSTGKALILTTVLLVVGFGSFVMADFLPNHYFGILCALILTLALLTDLLFLPALLAIWYRNDDKKANQDK